MEKEKVILFWVLLILNLILVNIVSIEANLISNKGVEFDEELSSNFNLTNTEKNSFLNGNLKNISSKGVNWVYISVNVKDFSGITIDYKKDSVGIQTIKDNQRWNVYRNTSKAILSTLSNDEFKLERLSEWGRSFAGNITQEGFDKLLKDSRVEKIYAKKNFQLFSANFFQGSTIYILLLIILLIILGIV